MAQIFNADTVQRNGSDMSKEEMESQRPGSIEVQQDTGAQKSRSKTRMFAILVALYVRENPSAP